MYLTILEYALVRLGLGAVRLVLRAAGLLVLAVMWASRVLMRLALRPLMRELARAIGRLRGQWQLAARSTPQVRSAAGVGRR
jgi:hypothetical protein